MDFALATIAVVSVLSTVLSTGAAWVAWSAANEARAEATSIQGLISQIRKSESECERLDQQFRHLRGLLYKRTKPPKDEEPVEELETSDPAAIRARLRAEHGLPMIRRAPSNGAEPE